MDAALIRWIANPDQVNLHRVNPISYSSLADELCKATSKAQSPYAKQLICKRSTEEHITNFLKASITTDSMQIFSITFCTVVFLILFTTSKIAKGTFRIVLYMTTFYMQHCGVARFVLKQWFVYNCPYNVADMYNFVCYWKTVSLYCELINANAV